MDMNTNDEYYDEIDLVELILHILKHWRLCIVMALIAGILGGGIAVLKNIRHNNAVTKFMQESSVEVKPFLTEEEMENIYLLSDSVMKPNEKVTVQNMITNYQQYDLKRQYTEKSIYFNLDPNCVYADRVTYYVEIADFDSETSQNYLDNLVRNYMNYISNLASIDGYDGDMQSIRELISVSLYDPNAGFNSSFDFKVIGATESDVRLLASRIDDEIQKFQVTLSSQLHTHSITRVNETVTVNTNESLMARRISVASELDKLMENLEKAYAKFSLYQAVAYYYGVKNVLPDSALTFYDVISKNKLYSDSITTMENPYSVDLKDGLIKFIVNGILLGGFAACGYIALVFMLDGKIKTANEVKHRGIYVIGDLSFLNPAKGEIFIDKWIRNLYNNHSLSFDDARNLAVEHTKSLCNINKVDSVIITSSDRFSLEEKYFVDLIIKALSDSNIKTVVFSDMVNSVDAIKTVGPESNVIFVEQLYYSKSKDLNRCIEICKKHNASVLGIIIL